MMNFRQWQVINETYGRIPLGVKTPGSVTVGSRLSELGLEPGDMADDLSGGQVAPIDVTMGADPTQGMLPGMLPGPAPAPAPMPGDTGKITIDDLDPTLLALLGIDPEAANQSGMGDDEGGEGTPWGDGDGDEGGEDEDGDGAAPKGLPFDKDAGGDSDDDGDESEPDDDGDDDEDGDGVPDQDDDDDDNDGVPDEEDKDDEKPEDDYSKKFMGKGMKGCCHQEEVEFYKSLLSQSEGNVRKTFSDGMPR